LKRKECIKTSKNVVVLIILCLFASENSTRMLRPIVSLFILIVFTLPMQAKGWRAEADSLIRILENETSDTGKINLCLDINGLLRTNKPVEAFSYAVEAKKIAEKIQDKKLIVLSILRHCDFYSLIGEYTTSLEMAYDALEIAGEDYKLISLCHNRIGTVHASLNNFGKTLYHNKKSLYNSSKSGDSAYIIVDMHNVGLVYINLEMYDSALYYLRKTNEYEISKTGKPDPYSLSNIGNVFLETGDYDSALYYHLEAYKCDSIHDQKYLMCLDQQYISDTYLKMKKYDKARSYAFKSIALAEELDAYDINIDNYEVMYKIFRAEGDYEKALDYALLYSEMKDTLREKTKQSLIHGLETKYKVKEQENKLKLLEKQKKLFIILTILSILLLLSMIVTFILVTRRQKLNRKLMKELQQANESKEKLISIIGHDLRGSVGSLRSAAKAISEGMTNLDDTRHLLESFYPVADTTYDLLENLLTWTKCNKEKILPSFETINLKQLADKSIEHTHHFATAKSISVINNMEDTTAPADKNMILSIMRNLLTNAIKFSHQKSEVHLNSNIENDYVVVSIHDDGIGIEPKVLDQLLKNPEVFQSPGTSGERGSGLGISICKTFLESHNGRIWAESNFGEGSTFYFSLPLKKAQ